MRINPNLTNKVTVLKMEQPPIPPEFRCRCGRHDMRDQMAPVSLSASVDYSLLPVEWFQGSGSGTPFVVTGDLAEPEQPSQPDLAPRESYPTLDRLRRLLSSGPMTDLRSAPDPMPPSSQ